MVKPIASVPKRLDVSGRRKIITTHNPYLESKIEEFLQKHPRSHSSSESTVPMNPLMMRNSHCLIVGISNVSLPVKWQKIRPGHKSAALKSPTKPKNIGAVK